MKTIKFFPIFILLLLVVPTFVSASILDDLQNTAEGLTSIVNTTFDYIVRFIQWIFITGINIYFVIVFLVYWAILFLFIYIPTQIEPYITNLQKLTKKLMAWFKGGR